MKNVKYAKKNYLIYKHILLNIKKKFTEYTKLFFLCFYKIQNFLDDLYGL
jgi:hypothetical protein